MGRNGDETALQKRAREYAHLRDNKETERMLITKLSLRSDGRVNLTGRGHKFVDMLLFDASDLLEVGIDPGELTPGEEIPCRFWALYQLSEKENQAGNPYKDVVDLEPALKDQKQPAADDGEIVPLLAAILEELKGIRQLLQPVQPVPPIQPEPPQNLPTPTSPPEAEAPSAPVVDVTDDLLSIDALESLLFPKPSGSQLIGAPPLPQTPAPRDRNQARTQFYELAGAAITDNTLSAATINTLTQSANTSGWADALVAIRQHLAYVASLS